MVYCTKCGARNPDDAQVCSQCGASLNPEREERERIHRRYEAECFGMPHGGAIIILAIGVIIVFAGLIAILRQAGVISTDIDVGPFALIVFGILILIGALYRMSRR